MPALLGTTSLSIDSLLGVLTTVDGPDLTKEVELSPLGSGQRQVPVQHAAVQTVALGTDEATQTDHAPEHDHAQLASGFSAMMDALDHPGSHEVSMGGYDAGVHINSLAYHMAGQPTHMNIAPPPPMFNAFAAHVWPRFHDGAHVGFTHAHAIPASSAAVTDGAVTSAGVMPQSYFHDLGGDSVTDAPVTSTGVTPRSYYQDIGGEHVTDAPVTSTAVTESNGLGAIGDLPAPAKNTQHKEIVDESEDLAIEQSLFQEMEKEQSQSYASALHTTKSATGWSVFRDLAARLH